MKYITFIIIALIALMYCFQSPLWAAKAEPAPKTFELFTIEEGSIISKPACYSTQQDDQEIDEYTIYPHEQDIS